METSEPPLKVRAVRLAIYAHVHILADHVTLPISQPEKLVSCLAASLAKGSQEKTLRIESHASF